MSSRVFPPAKRRQGRVFVSVDTAQCDELRDGFSQVVQLCGQQRAFEDRRGPSGFSSGWHLHVTLLMLWSWVVLLSVPSLLVWARGLQYSLRLDSDPNFACAVTLFLSSAIVWQRGVPFTHR